MYCNQQDLVNRFGERELVQLTDKEGDQNIIVTAVASQAIEDACATVDGYLSGRYTLPMANVPNIINRITCDIARYYLYDDVLDEQHQAAIRHKHAMDFLNKVSTGAISLKTNTGSGDLGSANLAELKSAGSVFARDKSKGFI